MQNTSYPNTNGVPVMAVMGPSGVGKSTMIKKLISYPVASSMKIEGTSAAQTTLIPTQFYIKQEPWQNQDVEYDTQLKLRITLRTELVESEREIPTNGDKKSRKLCLDENAVFIALQYGIIDFVNNSSSTGISVDKIKNHIESGKYFSFICDAVNGAVRFTYLKDDVEFKEVVERCALSLVDAIDIDKFNSAIAAINTDIEKKRVRKGVLKDQLYIAWDEERKNTNSSVCKLINFVDNTVLDLFYELIPCDTIQDSLKLGHECFSVALDVSNKNDKKVLEELVNPYALFSLIIEKYEIACTMSKGFRNTFFVQYEQKNWIHNQLPFRLIITDTVGLTQDTDADEYDVSRRLNAALNTGCHGILVMMPPMKDGQERTLFRAYSTQTDEGRRIRRKDINIYLGIAKIDEEITPSVEFEEDEDAYHKEMKEKRDALYKRKEAWKTQIKAKDARYITNSPKKIKAYLDDLKEIDPELTEWFAQDMSIDAIYRYLFDITKEMQERMFPNHTPIFYRVNSTSEEGTIKIKLVNANDVKDIVNSLSAYGDKYYISQWLHWNTAYAFYNATLEGRRFLSKAVQNGRISIYIKGDVNNAIMPFQNSWQNNTEWDRNIDEQVDISAVDLINSSSKSLLERVNAEDNIVISHIKNGLYSLFRSNFTGDFMWRYWRVIDRVACRLSCEGVVRDGASAAFQHGRLVYDASGGVEEMLYYYQCFYNSANLADTVAEIMNEEFTKEFNNFFFPLYD